MTFVFDQMWGQIEEALASCLSSRMGSVWGGGIHFTARVIPLDGMLAAQQFGRAVRRAGFTWSRRGAITMSYFVEFGARNPVPTARRKKLQLVTGSIEGAMLDCYLSPAQEDGAARAKGTWVCPASFLSAGDIFGEFSPSTNC